MSTDGSGRRPDGSERRHDATRNLYNSGIAKNCSGCPGAQTVTLISAIGLGLGIRVSSYKG